MENLNSSSNPLQPDKVKGYVLGPGQGVPGFDADVKASRISSGGAITVMESLTRGGAPAHVHSREDECFYVMEGTIIVHCGEQIFEAGPGCFVFLPRGIPHSWDVTGGQAANLLIITTPAGFEEFMQAYHAGGPASDEDKDRIAARYGIQWVRQEKNNKS